MAIKLNKTKTMLSNPQKQPPEVFCKNGVFRNFAKFTEKDLCQNLRLATLLKKRLLRNF